MSTPSASPADHLDPSAPGAAGGPRLTPLAALSFLYTAQGIPFGFAAEYLPVVLRQAHYSMGQIGLLGLLQLPWQLKVLWAHAADGPTGRRHGRPLLFALQLLMAGAVALFAVRPFALAPNLWFVLTAVCALMAATQDVFVDALAVRTLGPSERGLGNTAQVAGYRVGMLAGGAGLLLAGVLLGERWSVLACAALVALAGAGAFWLRSDDGTPVPDHAQAVAAAHVERLRLGAMLKHLVSREARPVLLLALTFKLGLHMAGVLIKPMAVDAGWTNSQIALSVVSVGIGAAIAGAVVGGLLHGALREQRALAVAAVMQAAVCIPLVIADRMGAPVGWTTVAIAAEHFATGLGTTVLFAALMSATRTADAGRHYTVLTSANVLCGAVGAGAGGFLADKLGRGPVFALATVVSLAPLVLLPLWPRAMRASAGAPDLPGTEP